MSLSAKLATHPDRERLKLRVATIFLEHQASLWPEGVPEEATPEFIRANVEHIVDAIEHVLRHDGRDVHRLPHRLHWLLWLLDDFDIRTALDG